MKICIPIIAPTMQQALKDIAKASKHADIIELRLDRMANLDCAALIKASSKPVIVTNRRKPEGGLFTGSEHERITLLAKALHTRPAFVDIELTTSPKLRRKIMGLAHSSATTKIILSHHNMKQTPSSKSLLSLAHRMLRFRPHAIKIVTFSKSHDDNARMMELVSKNSGEHIIGFCMGRIGQSTRITTLMNGGWMTFFSLDAESSCASGQISTDNLLAGVIGSAARYSLSPVIHNTGLRTLSINGLYLPLEINSDNKAIAVMKKLNIRMFSVTTPFKQSVMKHLDRINPTAKKIGAVNTVINQDGICTGFNTDGIGMLHSIGNVKSKSVAVIGAGGAARSIAFHLKEAGADVTVYNRTASKARTFARVFNVHSSPLTSFTGEENILINATTVGMEPRSSLTPVPKKSLREAMTVADAVYHPLRTKLIRDAQRVGCRVITGDRMLLEQAFLQFKLMTGKKPPKKIMTQALRAALPPDR